MVELLFVRPICLLTTPILNARYRFDFMFDMAFGGGFELMAEGDTLGLWGMMEAAISYVHLTHTFEINH